MPNPFISIRLPPEIIGSLDEVASQRGMTRSALIKELLSNCHNFYRFIESEKLRQQSERLTLNGNLSKWILDHMPENTTPELIHFLGEVMHHAAESMVAEGKKRAKKKDQTRSEIASHDQT